MTRRRQGDGARHPVGGESAAEGQVRRAVGQGLAVVATLLALAGGGASGAPQSSAAALPLTLRLEAQASLGMASRFLLERQLANGSWANHPVITSLVALALSNGPAGERADGQAAVGRGLNFIAGQALPEGGIWNRETQQYPIYSTAISLLALIRANRPGDLATLRRGRNYLLRAQCMTEAPDHPWHGGFSAGNTRPPDLTESQWAIELLYLTDFLDRPPLATDADAAGRADAAYRRAAHFIARCQNSTAGDEATTGRFADRPADGAPEPPTPGTPRSAAFLTAVGLKSLLYARVPADDPRCRAALSWLAANAPVQQNGDCGEAGYYTYLYSLGKCLRALETAGAGLDAAGLSQWPERLVRELLRRQSGPGTWRQAGTDWWENRPELAAAYAMLTLELALRSPGG